MDIIPNPNLARRQSTTYRVRTKIDRKPEGVPTLYDSSIDLTDIDGTATDATATDATATDITTADLTAAGMATADTEEVSSFLRETSPNVDPTESDTTGMESVQGKSSTLPTGSKLPDINVEVTDDEDTVKESVIALSVDKSLNMSSASSPIINVPSPELQLTSSSDNEAKADDHKPQTLKSRGKRPISYTKTPSKGLSQPKKKPLASSTPKPKYQTISASSRPSRAGSRSLPRSVQAPPKAGGQAKALSTSSLKRNVNIHEQLI